MNHPSLRPLPPRETATQACARSLREAIVEGRLRPGERLPPERELAATFGVNRLTLRAALAQLQAARLLLVRHGSGCEVRDFREHGGPELLPTVALASARGPQRIQVVSDLLLVRRLLARGVLERLVVVARDRKVLARLRELVERFETEAERATTPQERMEADLAFTGGLVELTGSTVFQLMVNPVARVLAALPDLVAAGYAESLEANVVAARALLAGLEARTPGLAETAMSMLEAIDETVIGRLGHARGRR